MKSNGQKKSPLLNILPDASGGWGWGWGWWGGGVWKKRCVRVCVHVPRCTCMCGCCGGKLEV